MVWCIKNNIRASTSEIYWKQYLQFSFLKEIIPWSNWEFKNGYLSDEKMFLLLEYFVTGKVPNSNL